jgi:hemerythrin
MAYQWDSSLETGYEKVDNQHKQLFVALNDIIDASTDGKGEAAIFKTLDFLTGYTIMHFADEEKLQVTYTYPDYPIHTRLHDDFKVTVGELTTRLRNEGPSKEMVKTVAVAVGDWLLHHIKGDDFRMATFVKAKEAATKRE